MALKNVAKKNPAKSGSESGFFRKNPDQNPDLEEGFNLGGIQHKMMSPVKGPSQEASKLCNYPSYKDMPADSSVENMDIFRVERLWINNKGERFAFGCHRIGFEFIMFP